jgi:hypothetical protein
MASAGTASADPEESAGPRLSVGRAFLQGLEDGLYERLEIDASLTDERADGRRSGAVGTALFGVNAWAATEGFGIGLSTNLMLGIRHPIGPADLPLDIVAIGGPGLDWIFVDDAQERVGVGIMAPMTRTMLGFDLDGVLLLAETSAQYRWQWGAKDRLVLCLGASAGITYEAWDD